MEELIREWDRYCSFLKKEETYLSIRGRICSEGMYKPTFEGFIEFYKHNN